MKGMWQVFLLTLMPVADWLLWYPEQPKQKLAYGNPDSDFGSVSLEIHPLPTWNHHSGLAGAQGFPVQEVQSQTLEVELIPKAHFPL